MPAKTKYPKKKPFAKKKAFKKWNTKKKYTMIPRGVSTYQNISPLQRFRYCDAFTLTPPVGGGPIGIVFSANSCYSPYVSGGANTSAHQPLRYDQMSTFYRTCTVLSSRIRIESVGQGNTTQNLPSMVAMLELDNVSNPSVINYQQDIEQGRTKWRVINNSDDVHWKLSKGFSAKKWFKLSSIKDNQSSVGAYFNQSPTRQAFYIFYIQSLPGATATIAGQFLVTIDYLSLWSEPVDLAVS